MTQGLTYNGTMHYRAGLKEFCTAMNPQYMMTLSFNKPGATSYTYAADRVRQLHGRLDRHLLGPSWSRVHTLQRSHILAIPQGHNCSGRSDSEYLYDFHLHFFLRPAPYPKMKLSEQEMEDLTRKIWTGLVPAGGVYVDPDVYDPSGAMGYCSRLMAGGISTSIGIQHYVVN